MIPIYILTKGRVGHQSTLEQLPKKYWGKRVWLVCGKDEDHGDYPVVNVPEAHNVSIAAKRQWVSQHSRKQGSPHHIQADDDITFRPRVTGNIVDFHHVLSVFDDIAEYKNLGVACGCPKAFSQNKAEVMWNGTFGGTFRLYNNAALAAIPQKFSDVGVMEDLHIMLSLIEAGYDVAGVRACYFDNKMGRQSKVGGNLGEGAFASTVKHDKAVKQLVALHNPDLVWTELKTAEELAKPSPRPSKYRVRVNVHAFTKVRNSK